MICAVCMLSCSVQSNSLRPHGRQPARLLRPWGSPGKNTGVSCHSLLQGVSQPGDWTQVSNVAGRFFTKEPPGLNDIPQIHIHLKPENVALLGNRIYADVNKEIMRWNHTTAVFIGEKRRNFKIRHTDNTEKKTVWRYRQRLEWHSYKARNSKDCQQLLEARSHATNSPPKLSEDINFDLLDLNFWLPEPWDNVFLLF